MASRATRYGVVGLILGFLPGLILGGFWPTAPLHAVATDRTDNFCIATGIVDENIEAVFLLDSLTGTLRGAVLSNQAAGFRARYETNVLADLARAVTDVNVRIAGENAARKREGAVLRPEVRLPQAPRFMMVTGATDLRRGAARAQPGKSVVYVAEATTGIVLAYAVPWSATDHQTNRASVGTLILWAADQFSNAVVRP